MENQPKLGACVLGTKGVGFNGKGRDFPFRCRSQTASSEDQTPIASAPRVSIDQEDFQNAPLPSYQTRPDRHHGSPGSTRRQHTTTCANRGVKSSRQTKKLRVCITDLRGRSGQGNFSGRGIGDGDRLLRGLVVCRCCLPSDALVNGRRGRRKPTQDRGGHVGRDGVDCLSLLGTAWQASSGTQ